MNLENLTTERRNENTMGLDEMSVKEALQKMNQEDQKVAMAVGQELAAIEPVVMRTNFWRRARDGSRPHRWWSKSNDCRSRRC